MKTNISYLTIIKISILVISIGIAYFYFNKNKQLKAELLVSKSNEKAYIASRDSLTNNNKLFQYKIEQLSYYNDSVLLKLKQAYKELNIKEKNIKQLQYLLSSSQRKDTIFLKDTIFKESTFKLDTLIGDKWFSTRLLLEYPNKIAVSPKYVSEKYIIFSNKKETINPPKNFFLWRWFQKKHIIVTIDVLERNPYEDKKNKEQRFIEIIK